MRGVVIRPSCLGEKMRVEEFVLSSEDESCGACKRCTTSQIP
jgi:hypothetical protein